jgi:hypothetical protein
VLDIDANIKPLYGRPEGAEIGCNPCKPMHPSPVLHTFLVSNLRLALDVQVSLGKQHTSRHAKAALARMLYELGRRCHTAYSAGIPSNARTAAAIPPNTDSATDAEKPIGRLCLICSMTDGVLAINSSISGSALLP